LEFLLAENAKANKVFMNWLKNNTLPTFEQIKESSHHFNQALNTIDAIGLLKKYINEKKGRGFGSGVILDMITKIPIPVYSSNAKMNLEKINKVMDDFEHETKDLWKIDGKTYKNLTEIEDDIEKTDKEIDEMVYELYGITEDEKKIIEESLK